MRHQALRRRLRRIDTLFLRLFLLMWLTLVISHLVAFSVVSPARTGWITRLPGEGVAALPPLPSLPPVGPMDRINAPGPGAGALPPPGPAGPQPFTGQNHGLPARSLWLDFALRALLIGVGAAIGARWLSAPMRRLAQASTTLAQGLDEGRDPPALDEGRGTVEVRESARAFNRMAQALRHRFKQRSLHMAAVSHDLRTPLTRLRLRLEQLPEAAAQAAGQDIHAMDELIDASLAVVREQSIVTPPALMDLGALLQSLADDRAEQGQAVTLRDPAEGELALRVRARPASLRRILDNLVDNALRYGHAARLALRSAEGGVAVAVDDDGPGIAPEQIERVLQPWVRLTGDTAAPGSGLGLAIAHDLALREGGRLTLANRPGGGLRATLWLPLA